MLGARIVSGRTAAPSVRTVVVIAAVLRIAAVAGPVRFDDDLWRYLWDGRALRAGVSPYEFAPSAVLEIEPEYDRILLEEERYARLERLADLATEPDTRAILERVNFPFYPTIYPPASQLAFATLTGPRGVRALVAGCDLLTVVALVVLLGRLGRPRWWAIAYAWHPLPILEFGAAGHQDAIGLAAWVWGLALLERTRRSAATRSALAGVLLALAAAVKLFPLIGVWFERRRLGGSGIAAAVATLVVVTLPFVWLGPVDPAGLAAYLERWEFFSGPFALLSALRADAARPLIAVGLALLALLFGRRVDRRGGTVAAASLWVEASIVLSPVVDPWYVPWALAFATLRRSIAWPLFGLAIPLAYLPHPPEGHSIALRAAVWVPFLVLWCAELRRSRA